MSQFGKLTLLVGFCILIIGSVLRILLGLDDLVWAVWAPVIIFGVCIGLALFKDRSFVVEFLTLKTTRHGMNMGTVILGILVLLGTLNFIAAKRNKKWDLTDEKLNSLSEQSIQILKGLDSELKLVGFFIDNVPEQANTKEQFLQVSELMRTESSHVKVESVHPQKRPDLVKQYGVEFPGVVVLTYKGKQNTVSDFTEESVINAIIKISRGQSKVIYSLAGHGELNLNGQGPLEAGSFKKSLEESNYDVRELNLVQTPQIPEDAEVLMILGPKQALFDSEINLIREFLKKGGKVFIAADPGQKHNVGKLSNLVGIKFEDNYIIDSVGQLIGASAALAVGVLYSPTSEITKGFQNQMSGFQLASAVTSLGGTSIFKTDELVKSSPNSFSKQAIESSVAFNRGVDKKGPFAIGISSVGKIDGAEKEALSVVFGDSDFLVNQFYLQLPMNKDLALNTIAFLSQEKDLISIRPKAPKSTQFVMTQTQFLVLLFGIILPVPLISLIASITLWYRRRHA